MFLVAVFACGNDSLACVLGQSSGWMLTCSHTMPPPPQILRAGGKAFEDLPESWTCPVCGAPKGAYRRLSAGEWVHEEEPRSA